jgi:glycosyltransferase involved in cell wall biosynthesis
MRVLWTHNFNPAKSNRGTFMMIAAEGLRRRGIDLHLEYLGNLRSIRNLYHARERVRRLAAQFDIVHAQYGSACALATAAAKRVPKVVSIRGNDWNVHRESFGFSYAHTRAARLMTRASVGHYDCVLTVSNRMAADLRRTFAASRVETLPSPIDLDRFRPQPKAEARARLGYPDSQEKWVLFTGLDLTDPIKRFALARTAFELAQAQRGDLRMRIANEMPHEQLPLFVATCDVILCTSETEGWPNSVKEALACNVPFVSTDVSDLREIAAREPICRICAPDARTLASAIVDVLEKNGHTDLRQYVAGMATDAATDRLVDIYHGLLSPQAPGRASVALGRR